jgi:hypothetical protein
MAGQVDESRSAFELISIAGDSIRADWKTALCNQPAIKEEMAHIESEGQVPKFVVTVSNIVAAKDYALELSKIAASIVTECLGDGLKATTNASPDGNSIIMTFDGYPLYNSFRKGKVFVQFPRSTFVVRKGCVMFVPIQQAQCRYYQEKIGKPLAHPHVFNDGHPCWDNSKRERGVDFITNMIETLSLQNVTKDSIVIGHCASGVMGVQMEALKNAQAQQKKVMDTLKCKPIVTDRRKLESYVNKRWCSKITMLMKAA